MVVTSFVFNSEVNEVDCVFKLGVVCVIVIVVNGKVDTETIDVEVCVVVD